MADFITWWKTHRPTQRRLAQLYAAVLYNANLKGFVNGQIYTGNTKAVCVPGLNCYSCPGAVGACPLGSLQNALASSGHVAGWYVFGLLLLFGIIAGRTICGFACPLGLIQDLLHKIPVPKIRKSRVTRVLSCLKYVILGVFVIAIPLMYGLANNMPLPAFCKYFCPAGTMEGAVALLSNPANEGMFGQLGILFTRKFVILIIIGLLCIFCYRSFCRFICPLGAIYSLFNRFCLVGMKVDQSRCNHCGNCVRHCEMDIRHVGDRECISCGNCMSVCAQSAISFKCGKVTLKGPDTGKHPDPEPVRNKRKRNGRIVWGVLLAILAGVLIYFNVIDTDTSKAAQDITEKTPAAVETVTDAAQPADNITAETTAAVETVTDAARPADNVTTETPAAVETVTGAAQSAQDFTSDAPTGPDVGQQLADFTCTLTDGSTFHLADHRGQIVIINQWATYCTPCVHELPFFEQLKEENPDIVILAVHHWLTANPKPEVFMEEQGWNDWKTMFTVDTQDMNILSKIKGDNVMPRTVVLNRKGEVVYNEQRSVTYEALKEILKKAEE